MISSHVLDTSLGRPASALAVHLDVLEPDGQWRRIASAHTNPDGRASDLAGASSLTERTCRLTFETGPYFRGDEPADQVTAVAGLVAPHPPRRWDGKGDDPLFALKADLLRRRFGRAGTR